MRPRTLILFALALLLAGGTALFARSWLVQRAAQVQAAAPAVRVPVPPAQAVLVARMALNRGQILKPEDFAWQRWPAGPVDPAYIVRSDARPHKSLAGWVAREPFAPGEPITTAKIVAPNDRGFLAAVLRPGMRAVSVPVTATSGIAGFIFPGDRVDILVTQTVIPPGGKQTAHREAETILHGIRVLAVDQRLAGKDGEAALAHTATLEVTSKQSEIIAVASDMGKLSLSLRSLADAGQRKDTDSPVPAQSSTYTLDSEVNPLLPKPFAGKENPGATTITILRGNGSEGHVAVSQPPPRGA